MIPACITAGNVQVFDPGALQAQFCITLYELSLNQRLNSGQPKLLRQSDLSRWEGGTHPCAYPHSFEPTQTRLNGHGRILPGHSHRLRLISKIRYCVTICEVS